MSFAAFPRRAANASVRRRSLLALGAAAVGAAAAPGSVRAGKGAKKCKQKVKAKCAQQAEQCLEAVEFLRGQVSNDMTRQACLDGCRPCCAPEADCLNDGNFECLVACAIFLQSRCRPRSAPD